MEFNIERFYEELQKEPELLPSGVGECLKDIYKKGSESLPRPDKVVQSVINTHMCRIGKKYNKDLVLVANTEKDNFVFENARIIPLVSIEWILAALELFHHHGHALGWLGKRIKDKSYRILKENYGSILSEKIETYMEESRKLSVNSWNIVLYEFIETYVDGVKNRVSVEKCSETEIRKYTRSFIHIMLSAFSFIWGAKEVQEMESLAVEAFFISRSREEVCSILYIAFASFIGPSGKDKQVKEAKKSMWYN